MNKIFLKIAILCLLPAFALPAAFGKNKVNYKKLVWKELPTANFNIYFTLEDDNLAKEFSICFEEAYAGLSADLKVNPPGAIKVFLYASPLDFEQTNITAGIIDEGVGGFTESLKNRIVLPVYTSAKRMKEVLTHELTHELQFESLFSGFGKPYQFAKALFIPLWVMEGMAEYGAEDYDDSITDMLLRDAALNNKIKDLGDLGSFNYIDGHDIVLMYKESQYVFDFIAKTYGKDKVALMLKEFGYIANMQETVIQKALNIEFNAFNKKWQYDLKARYFAQAKGKKDAADYAQKLTKDGGLRPVYNRAPVFSADGNKLYYLSDQKVYTGLFELNIKTGEIKELLGRCYDSYSGTGRALSVSKDGKYLAFAAKAAGVQKIRFWDLKENRVTGESDFGLEIVSSPCFGPDNNILFTGVKDGKSDVYAGNMKGEIIKRLTEDRYDDNGAVFSPDGEEVYYVSERESGFRNIYKIKNWKTEPVSEDFLTGRHNFLSPDLNTLQTMTLTADINGIYNLYRLNMQTKELFAFTDVKGGGFSPSGSADGKKVVFSYFEESCYNLYLADLDPAQKLEKAFIVEPLPVPAKKDYRLTNFPVVPYRLDISLDLIYFLFGYDSASGLVGGGYLSFSDLLGEHNFEFFGAAVKDYQSGWQLNYVNRACRINFGVSFYTGKTYGSAFFTDKTTDGTYYYKEETGLSLPFIYPFDKNTRVSLLLKSYYKNNYADAGAGNHSSDLTNSLVLEFVNDRLTYNMDTPCAGGATAVNIERADYVLGGTRNYVNIMAEDQEYLFLDKETTAGFRFFAGASFGPQAGYFVLGGEKLRGYPGEYTGSNILLANMELRFSLIEKADVSVWPAAWLLLKKVRAVIFSDQGIVFNHNAAVTAGEVKNGVGAGLRFHAFLWQSYPVILRIDAGFRTDAGSTNPVYYIGLNNIF